MSGSSLYLSTEPSRLPMAVARATATATLAPVPARRPWSRWMAQARCGPAAGPVNTDDRLFVVTTRRRRPIDHQRRQRLGGRRNVVGANTGYTGVIDFGTNGGTLTTQTLLASPAQLAGTGTINTNGLVSDIDLNLFCPRSEANACVPTVRPKCHRQRRYDRRHRCLRRSAQAGKAWLVDDSRWNQHLRLQRLPWLRKHSDGSGDGRGTRLNLEQHVSLRRQWWQRHALDHQRRQRQQLLRLPWVQQRIEGCGNGHRNRFDVDL